MYRSIAAIALLILGAGCAGITTHVAQPAKSGSASAQVSRPATIDDASNNLTGIYASASILRARDYGILPTNSASTNDTGFALLKTKMLSSSTTVWRVIFDPGTYNYTNNRWLYGVNQVIIEGYGTTFTNTSSSGVGVDNQALYSGDIFWNGGDAVYSNTYTNGYLINTATAGSYWITTTTAADAGNFTPGMRVFISGYDQGGVGWPPNMRYFDYMTVSAASTTAIATLNTLVGGNYTANGGRHTYTAVPLTGGTGSGAMATVVVSGNAVTSVTLTSVGTGYTVSDSLSATTASLGGTGTGGFSISVATVAGIVTFTDELTNYYDSRWPDTTNLNGTGLAFGSPRIISLQRTSAPVYNFPQLVWFRGVIFTASGSRSAQVAMPGAMVIYEDVTSSGGFTSSESGTTIYRRCTSNSIYNEIDKLIDRVVYEDSVINSTTANKGIVGGTGANAVSIIRTKVNGGPIQLSPRSLSIEDSDITPTANGYQGISTVGGYPVRSMSVKNTRVHNTGQTYGASNQASPGLSLTVGSVSGTDILVPFDSTGKALSHYLDYGLTITNTVTGNTGTITGLWYDSGSPGNLHITGTWTTPTAGDVFHFYDVMKKYDGGGNVIVGTQIPFWRAPPGLSLPSGNAGTSSAKSSRSSAFPSTRSARKTGPGN
jgi:hypothetical protein